MVRSMERRFFQPREISGFNRPVGLIFANEYACDTVWKELAGLRRLYPENSFLVAETGWDTGTAGFAT